jgi:hypothetical protein
MTADMMTPAVEIIRPIRMVTPRCERWRNAPCRWVRGSDATAEFLTRQSRTGRLRLHGVRCRVGWTAHVGRVYARIAVGLPGPWPPAVRGTAIIPRSANLPTRDARTVTRKPIRRRREALLPRRGSLLLQPDPLLLARASLRAFRKSLPPLRNPVLRRHEPRIAQHDPPLLVHHAALLSRGSNYDRRRSLHDRADSIRAAR